MAAEKCNHTYHASYEEIKEIMGVIPGFGYVDALAPLMPDGVSIVFTGIANDGKCPLCSEKPLSFDQTDEFQKRVDEIREQIKESEIDLGEIQCFIGK